MKALQKCEAFFILVTTMHPTVYILISKSINRFYVGFTTNLEKRIHFHQNPEKNKFTYKANDWELFFTITCESKKQGLNIEKHIKNMKSKKYIENLKTYPEISLKLLQKYLNC